MGAATNDLSGLLQKGLFEEEANRNLEAAAQAYQTVSAQFDKDRKLAATAIFRLGEIYRKQGKTNEAAGQYDRIVREFADQDTLVSLSRQNLTGMGSVITITGLQKTLADEQEVGRLAAQLRGIEKLKNNPEEQARAVLAFFPDETLKQMLLNLPKLKEQDDLLRANLQADSKTQFLKVRDKFGEWCTALGPKGFEPGAHSTNLVWDAEWELKKQFAWIKERVDFNVGVQKARLQVLQAAAGPMPDRESGASEKSAPATDDEEKEIRRLQAMIQNSPDLINAARGEDGTPLYQAASKGQLQIVKFLLDHGAAINAPNGVGGKIWSGWPPLIGAANGGHKAMVELLLARGADVNARDAQGLSALHQAARRGFKAVLEVLLDQRADVNARDRNEATPLHLAMIASPSAVIELLLARGAEVNAVTATQLDSGKFGFVSGTPLHVAIRRGERSLIELLLERKADVSAPAKGSMYAGRTPLQEAVSSAGPEIVELLLKRGADPNGGVKDLPLVAAAQARKVGTARVLLQGGAKPDLASKTSQYVGPPDQPQSSPGNEFGPYTPLQIAVVRRDVAMVKLLLEFNANANAKDPWLSPPSPLTRWALGDPELLKALLDAGADANAEAWPGSTLLFRAALDGQAAAVELLLAHGAKPDVRSDGKLTPLSAAIQKNCLTCAEALLAAKADANARLEDNSTPLHAAVHNGSKEMVALLIAHGTDVNATANTGWTPLHLAANAGKKDLLELLLVKGANPNVRTKDGSTPLDLAQAQVPQGTIVPAGATPESRRALRDEIVALLHQHGALDDLPNLDRIEVRRSSTKFSAIAFQMGTNGWNEFSLLELIALHYGLISTEQNAVWGVNNWEMRRFWPLAACQFPDLGHVVIRRPASAGPQRTEMAVNVAELLDSGECARDVKLKPGDIIEIPEADHPVNEPWAGLGGPQLSNLLHCVSRTVTISIKGTPTTVRLAPQFKVTNVMVGATERMQELTRGSFMLKSVLAQSKLLRASSDLANVKVTRRAATGGKDQEWVLNCSAGNDPDLWLRDGDVIEVPDKP